jgi:hypothetical protein
MKGGLPTDATVTKEGTSIMDQIASCASTRRAAPHEPLAARR